MPRNEGASSVLVVSGSEKGTAFFQNLLQPERFSPVQQASSAGEARRMLTDACVDLLIVNTPLPDEFGTRLAMDVSEQYGCGVLLVVKNELYEQVSYQLQDCEVLCLAKPCTAQMVYQSMRLLAVTQQRLAKMQQKTQSLQTKMEEIRLVNRAKWILIERFKMDEGQAHRTIEKQAMDTRSTRREIAENIIRLYEN